MKRLILLSFAAAALMSAAVRVNIAIGPGHPIHRTRTVIVHRAPIAVAPSVVYAPVVVWRPVPVAVPRRERLVWEDRETLRRAEDWVDTALPVRNSGSGVVLRVQGRVQVDFAEIHFGNGQVQVVDFREAVLAPGMYELFRFPGGRNVENVRIVARAEAGRADLNVLMRK
jgi:hypothetical protein